MGFEHTILVLERPRSNHALSHTATVTEAFGNPLVNNREIYLELKANYSTRYTFITFPF
jgi:hypothetical protein